MKKFLLILITAFLSTAATAQIEPGFRSGIRIDGGLSCLNNKYHWYEASFGYGVAFVAEYNFKPTLFLQSGAGIENIAYSDGSEKNNVFYAQIPVHIGYRYILNSGKSCFFQAGPTLGIGLHGPDIHVDGGDEPNPKYFGSDDHWCARRFDLGLGGRVGIELRKFQISVGANYGVIKVFRRDGGHNLSVNLGVAYMF